MGDLVGHGFYQIAENGPLSRFKKSLGRHAGEQRLALKLGKLSVEDAQARDIKGHARALVLLEVR